MLRAVACVFIALQVLFSVRTEMVILPVTVTDAHGHSVAGLVPANFRVTDEGRAQEIALFRSGEIPITFGLIVDHSQSMASKLSAVNAAVAAFARSGRPDDEMFVIGFSDRVQVLPLARGEPFTSDPAELDAALRAEQLGGTTALYDAVAEGLRHLAAGRSDRKALIVVSDGGDNASHLKYSQVRDLARQSQAVIYGVLLLGADFQDEDPEILKRICRDSGGTAYLPDAKNDVTSVFMQIARDLREQYTLGFVPAGSSKQTFHPVNVTAIGSSGVKLHVLTRAGYSTPPAK
jgi:Ca-activated chloride channel family protein